MTTATKQKQFAVSRVAFTKREAERILRRMKHFGVFHLRIIGSRGCWMVRGRSTAAKFCGYVVEETKREAKAEKAKGGK
jgi:hypothetical protein